MLLLSLHKEHADNIFSGRKTVELRKSFPDVSTGDRVYLYVASPVKAIMGYIVVKKVVRDNPANIWKRMGKKTAITKSQFDSYYQNKNEGSAVLVKHAEELSSHIPLNNLRESLPRFCPPQNYRFLRPSELEILGLS